MTSAKPCASMMMRASSSLGTDASLSTSVLRMLVPMPSSRHVSLAMAVWSPVTILTSMPFSMAAAMVALVSARGGSNSDSTPRYSHLGSTPGPVSVRATPSARKPRSASSCTDDVTLPRSSDALCDRRRMTCGAPLDTLNTVPSGAWIVASVRLSVGLKGTNSSSLYVASFSRSSPSGTACVMHRSIASWLPCARLEASAALKTTSSDVSPGTRMMGSRSDSLLSVSVPVLSEHRMVMPASSSMADRRAMMTLERDIMCDPTASVDVHTTSMAMGMDATRITITTDSTAMTLDLPASGT
jgi:hypothetical protein